MKPLRAGRLTIAVSGGAAQLAAIPATNVSSDSASGYKRQYSATGDKCLHFAKSPAMRTRESAASSILALTVSSPKSGAPYLAFCHQRVAAEAACLHHHARKAAASPAASPSHSIGWLMITVKAAATVAKPAVKFATINTKLPG